MVNNVWLNVYFESIAFLINE